MKSVTRLGAFLLIAAYCSTLLLPAVALSANNTDAGTPALVQCGYGTFTKDGSDQTSSIGCQACNLAQLVQNLINFAIGLSIPIAAVLFAWAGILYFTSGANPGNIDTAKKIFASAFIGFLIAITGWLVINTVLHALLDGGKLFQGGANWFTVQCAPAGKRPVNVKINDVIDKILPGVPKGGGVIAGACPEGTIPSRTGACQDTTSNTYTLAKGYKCPRGSVFSGKTGNCVYEDGTIVPPIPENEGALNSAIAIAASQYYGADTSAGPDGGNKACAWAVNNVLGIAGIAPVDGDSVSSMEGVLQGGRGTAVDQANAQVGDIVIFGGLSHVGICYTDGCAQVVSNSSTQARFTSIYPPTFGSRFYRLNN